LFQAEQTKVDIPEPTMITLRLEEDMVGRRKEMFNDVLGSLREMMVSSRKLWNRKSRT
jgi:hypothetical protein